MSTQVTVSHQGLQYKTNIDLWHLVESSTKRSDGRDDRCDKRRPQLWCFEHTECLLFPSRIQTKAVTLTVTDWHSPLLKRSQHVAFYVRRIWLGACQWRPAQGGKTEERCSYRWIGLGFNAYVLGLIVVSEGSYFEDEIWRRARSHCWSEDPVVVRVDQRLIQVQNQNLPLYCTWSLAENMDISDT